MSNDGCPSHGWSIITSASTYSQFAGLLAGFLFTGIVILFALKGSKHTKALSLFCAVFVVLLFDSYLFGLVSGDIADPYCTRVWSEGMAACGMLGVGAAGVFSAICWLLSVHVDTVAAQDGTEESVQTASSPERQALRLDLIASLMVHGANITASLLLARTAYNYLDIVYEQQASWVMALWQWVYAVPAVIVGTTLVPVWYRTRRRSKTSSVRSDDDQRKSTLFTVYGMLVYGVAGPFFVGTLTNLPDSLWAHPPLPLVVATVVIELLLPGALLVGLVLAVPSLHRPKQEANSISPDFHDHEVGNRS
jgi:MFS family permease